MPRKQRSCKLRGLATLIPLFAAVLGAGACYLFYPSAGTSVVYQKTSLAVSTISTRIVPTCDGTTCDTASNDSSSTTTTMTTPMYMPSSSSTEQCDVANLSNCKCGRAVMRMMNTVRVYFQDHNFTNWVRNLAPLIAREYEQQQQDEKEGNPWRDTAVLVTGQVRTGLDPSLISTIRRKIFNQLHAYGEVHVFAVLEPTEGGFASWHQEPWAKTLKKRTATFAVTSVEEMLRGYGATNFTLLLSTSQDDCMKPNCTFMSSLTCYPMNEGGMGAAQQHMKVDQALKMMRRYEKQRGRRFALVIKIRPDVLYVIPFEKVIPKQGLPVICRSTGAVDGDPGVDGRSRGDVYMVAERFAAPALGNYWKFLRNCPLDQVDGCTSKEQQRELCSQIKVLSDKLNCRNIISTNLLRHGLIDVTCAMRAEIIRPLPKERVKYSGRITKA